MRTNKIMRIASVILVAVMLSTCAISGTFAKYTTSATGTDSARVAYWGFDADAELKLALFDHKDTKIVSSNNDQIIAPGSSATTTFSFGYTPKDDTVNALTAGAIAKPEVDYTFTVNPTITGDYDALDANPNFKWTLKAPGAEKATEYDKVADFLAAIKLLSGDASGTKTYTAGNLPTNFTAADEVYTIGWVWTFETAGDGMADQDKIDTAMGNAQNLDDVTFEITITATQID